MTIRDRTLAKINAPGARQPYRGIAPTPTHSNDFGKMGLSTYFSDRKL